MNIFVSDSALKGCLLLLQAKKEGLAVARIARDDPSTLPGDDPFPRAH